MSDTPAMRRYTTRNKNKKKQPTKKKKKEKRWYKGDKKEKRYKVPYPLTILAGNLCIPIMGLNTFLKYSDMEQASENPPDIWMVKLFR